MKHLFVTLILTSTSFAFAGDEYSADQPFPYEYQMAVQAAFDSFAQRHQVLKVYPARTERVDHVTFDIEGYGCIAALKYNASEGGEVTCYPKGQLNGYSYHENQNGQLVRGRYVAPFTNRKPTVTKQCVYFDRLITYYAECGGSRRHRH